MINYDKNLILSSEITCCHCNKKFKLFDKARKHIWFHCYRVSDKPKYDLINNCNIVNYNYESLINYEDNLKEIGLFFFGKNLYDKSPYAETEKAKYMFFDKYREYKDMFKKIFVSYESDKDISDEELQKMRNKNNKSPEINNREIIDN